jgi:hypothetical protein
VAPTQPDEEEKEKSKKLGKAGKLFPRHKKQETAKAREKRKAESQPKTQWPELFRRAYSTRKDKEKLKWEKSGINTTKGDMGYDRDI